MGPSQEEVDAGYEVYGRANLNILPNEKDCPADFEMNPGDLYLDRGGDPAKSRICCPNTACGECASLAKHTIIKTGPGNLNITINPSLSCPHCTFHYWITESTIRM